MKLSKEEAKSIHEQIITRQSYLLTTIGSLAGFSVGLGLFILFALAGATFAISLFVPPFMVGFGAKFLGNPFEFKFKIIPGVFGMAIYAIGVYFIFVPNMIYLALTPINFVIAYYCSKAKLTQVEESAAWQVKFS